MFVFMFVRTVCMIVCGAAFSLFYPAATPLIAVGGGLATIAAFTKTESNKNSWKQTGAQVFMFVFMFVRTVCMIVCGATFSLSYPAAIPLIAVGGIIGGVATVFTKESNEAKRVKNLLDSLCAIKNSAVGVKDAIIKIQSSLNNNVHPDEKGKNELLSDLKDIHDQCDSALSCVSNPGALDYFRRTICWDGFFFFVVAVVVAVFSEPRCGRHRLLMCHSQTSLL